jgi:FAD/FMN-containing dehydrogenase
MDLLIDPNTHDAMHVAEEDALVASAIVYPSTTDEVQKIVHWANKHRIPISPISIGRNCMFVYNHFVQQAK